MGTQNSQIITQQATGNDSNFLTELNTSIALIVFFLKHSGIGDIGALLHANGVQELVLGAEAVSTLARQDDGSSANAEQGILQKHRTHRTAVDLLGDFLQGHDDSDTSSVILEELLSQIDGNHTSRATHTTETVRLDSFLELEVFDKERSQGRSGTEQGTIGNNEIDLLGLDTCIQNTITVRSDPIMWAIAISNTIHTGNEHLRARRKAS